ncbi:MAG: chemotaxis protein CheW [Pseudanabaenaceae cyanobacterium bins.39]|nr:chemotaxis protein CheW [Pseudanabaenaceae cyanobacterium bins.39]
MAEKLINSWVQPSNRYIVAKVSDRLITFPDTLVAEILILDRGSILPLPFYDESIIGVVHHQASVMPLLMLKSILGESRSLITESLTVVRLSQSVTDWVGYQLGGTGIVIDRVIGSVTIDEFQEAMTVKSYNFLEDFANKSANHDAIDSFADRENDRFLKKINQIVANIGENEYTPIEIILMNIPVNIWQPQRWRSS